MNLNFNLRNTIAGVKMTLHHEQNSRLQNTTITSSFDFLQSKAYRPSDSWSVMDLANDTASEEMVCNVEMVELDEFCFNNTA
jgi:hypothetical protein